MEEIISVVHTVCPEDNPTRITCNNCHLDLKADGYFWYGGRADDMLKVSGQWVSPAEIENALITHPAVLQAAVVGAANSNELIKPKAYIVLQSGYDPSEELVNQLKTFVKDRLVPFKYPRWIKSVPELPMTATGKIQRFALREGVVS